MQLNALSNNRAKRAKAAEPKTVVIRLNEIVAEAGKPSFFHGIDVDTQEPVKIRMMNVDEGAIVNVRKDESLEQAKGRIHNQYVGTDAKHRPRAAEIGNPENKVHCGKGGLLMFTKVQPTNDPDGSLKAHWVETLEGRPGTSCEKVLAHVAVGEIKDKENPEKIVASFVHADIIRPESATILSAANAKDALLSAFVNRDEEALRKPFVLLRLIDNESGKVITDLPEMRVNPQLIEDKIEDHDNGVSRTVFRVAEAGDTVKYLMDPENTDRDSLILRSVLVGLSGPSGYPDLSKVESAELRSDLNQIVDAVRAGAVSAEIIPGERVAAGPATKSSFLKQIQNEKHPLNSYRGSQFLPVVVDGKEERKPRTVKIYANTFVTSKVGAGDYRFFTKANLAEQSPTKQSLYTLATVNDLKATAEASKDRVQAANPAFVEASDEQFDPYALSGDEVDAQLAASADSAADLVM
ncbi:hypothetical protein R70006_05017 [Paraburkholderia domus]|uniref:hypothetical protein n=1 Tax=Paraburkholderia domus TaxID=2793075 RepID=UPI0019112A6E|nr:hypothetical protein [Paraburkholderia domus]MBK5051746.1 hypothetical protein [Burkholderia sp. R-70006]CAE6794726.1 hypothetical protein R70006_05017 [Paraburkholderia domus]